MSLAKRELQPGVIPAALGILGKLMTGLEVAIRVPFLVVGPSKPRPIVFYISYRYL